MEPKGELKARALRDRRGPADRETALHTPQERLHVGSTDAQKGRTGEHGTRISCRHSSKMYWTIRWIFRPPKFPLSSLVSPGESPNPKTIMEITSNTVVVFAFSRDRMGNNSERGQRDASLLLCNTRIASFRRPRRFQIVLL